jgi:hypothetical protein
MFTKSQMLNGIHSSSNHGQNKQMIANDFLKKLMFHVLVALGCCLLLHLKNQTTFNEFDDV